MVIYSGQKLLDVLSTASRSARKRLWIASPYIGSWKSVRCILGRKWWDDRNIDVRLITDEDCAPNGETLKRFEQRGTIHHLQGLHAKLYIVDDFVLLTSANLTDAAFTRRHEAGVILDGAQSQAAITLYNEWLSMPTVRLFNWAKFEDLIHRNRTGGEDAPETLPQLHNLPPDPGDFGGHALTNIFLDYERFLSFYAILRDTYVAVQQRTWPTILINFEIDGFLDFLYRHDVDLPSKPFATSPPRLLTPSSRTQEVKHWAKRFAVWAEQNKEDGNWKVENAKLVHRYLSRAHIESLMRAEIEQVAKVLNSMNDHRQLNRFLNAKQNTTAVIRNAWKTLLHDSGPLTQRMSICAGRLFSFKRSSTQELLAHYDPESYPIRNLPVNAGLRFFGLEVSAD